MHDDFNCDEDHSLMNGRLVLSAIGVGFAGYACLWDYLHPFPESRPVLIICACSYFVLMGILTLYIMYKVGTPNKRISGQNIKCFRIRKRIF